MVEYEWTIGYVHDLLEELEEDVTLAYGDDLGRLQDEWYDLHATFIKVRDYLNGTRGN